MECSENNGKLPRRRTKCLQKILWLRSIANIATPIWQFRSCSAAESTCTNVDRGKGLSHDEQVVGYYNTGDRMKYWGKVGAFWGGFWGFYSDLLSS